ncbi:hypothetical protein Glove_23g206 [Diversispora epigaea]|uniref:Uncharacterized protein n=1 Tax=Diversispora epigaea TaxID=1348612 RepID=A0A397JQP9_9GLOM|nr:hypothetical protein Glove_23g206 [Diversispora epigaea]
MSPVSAHIRRLLPYHSYKVYPKALAKIARSSAHIPNLLPYCSYKCVTADRHDRQSGSNQYLTIPPKSYEYENEENILYPCSNQSKHHITHRYHRSSPKYHHTPKSPAVHHLHIPYHQNFHQCVTADRHDRQSGSNQYLTIPPKSYEYENEENMWRRLVTKYTQSQTAPGKLLRLLRSFENSLSNPKKRKRFVRPATSSF